MIVAKREKIGKNYSKYLYLHNTGMDELPNCKILESKILAESVSTDPTEIFQVKLDSAGAYIVNKEGKEFDTGFSTKDLRRFFYCMI